MGSNSEGAESHCWFETGKRVRARAGCGEKLHDALGKEVAGAAQLARCLLLPKTSPPCAMSSFPFFPTGGLGLWKYFQSSDPRFRCGVIIDSVIAQVFWTLVLSSVKGENELSMKNGEEHHFVCQC